MNQTIAERYNLAPIHERTIFADDVRQAFTKLTEKQHMLLDMVVAKKFESENFFNNPNERVLQTLVSVDKVDNLIVVAEDTEEIANEFYNKDDWYKYTAGLILNLNTEACTKDDYYLKIHEITSAQVSNQIPSILLEKVNAYQREHDEPELDNVNQIEFNQFFSKEDAETVLNYIDLCSRFRDDIASQNYYLVPCSILNSFTRIDPDDHDILECDTAYIVDRYDEKRFYDELSEDLNYFCSRPDRCYELSKLDDPLEYSDSYRLCSDTFNYQVFKNKIDFENEMLKRQSLGDYLLLNKDQRANAVIPLLSFDDLDLSEQDSFIQDLMETIEEVGLDKTAKLSPCYAELIDYSKGVCAYETRSPIDKYVTELEFDEWVGLCNDFFYDGDIYFDVSLSPINIKTDLPDGCHYTLDGLNGEILENNQEQKKSIHR